MATNPMQATCLKCSTPMVAGAAFCGTCGTPAGSPGMPPPPPPMPPRPISHGARQVVVPMDQPNAMHMATGLLPRVGGEVVNQSPVQIAFRLGNYLTGRHTGTIDSFPQGPGRTAVNVTLKSDYTSLVPAALILLVTSIIVAILLAKSSVDGMYSGMYNNPYQPATPGIGSYLTWPIVFGIDALVLGLAAWMLAGPMLEARKAKLMNALQSIGGMPPGMPGMPGAPGFGPQPGPVLHAVPGQGTPVPATPFEQLRKLAELRDSGAISVDDFERAKAEIMKKVI